MKNEINPMQAKSDECLPFFLSPRCGAKTRRNTECRAPAVKNKKRCRMHGGAKGSGAPVGSQNALKHGFNTQEIKQLKRVIKLLLQN
ncbi:MAG: HGGxSTG domain-containing protein [Methylococcales bacterium]|nr:HGGxSTG domain-containing protein [Methylococcales bacterium]